MHALSRRRVIGSFVAVFFAALLTGCGLSGGYEPEKWLAHQARNESLQEWCVFAVLIDRDRHTQISWLQDQDHFEVFFITPGKEKAAASVEGTAQAAQVTIFDGEAPKVKSQEKGNDVDALFLESTGAPFPIAGLQYWLRGLSNPEAKKRPIRIISNKNRLDYLLEDGLEVNFKSYTEHEGYVLPKRIQIDSPRHQIRYDIHIQLWETGQAARQQLDLREELKAAQ